MYYTGMLICLISISAAGFFYYMYNSVIEENRKLHETIAISKALFGSNKKIPKKNIEVKEKSIVEFPNTLHTEFEKYLDVNPYKFENRPDLAVNKELTYMPATNPTRENRIVLKALDKLRLKDLEFSIKSGERIIAMSFVLINKKNAKKAIKGKTFTIFKNNIHYDTWFSHPRVELRRGRPVAYRKGKAFYVGHYKTINHHFIPIDEPNLYNKVTILVYSNIGRLLVDETVPIDMIL